MAVVLVVFGDVAHAGGQLFFAAVLKLRDNRALHHEQHVSARAPVVGEIPRAVLDDARADVALRKGAPQRRYESAIR